MKIDLEVTGKLGGYYLAEQYRKNAMVMRGLLEAAVQILQAFLAEGVQNGDDAAAFQSVGVSQLATTAYEENISTFSKSVVGNQKI